MILQSLVALARRERLVKHPAYADGKLHGVLVIDDAGRLLSFVDQRDEASKPRIVLLPKPPKRTVAIAPAFAWDNARYVLGRDAAGGQRAIDCRDAFAAQVREAAGITNDPGLRAIAAFFDALEANLLRLDVLAPGAEWTGSEGIAFQRHADAPLLVHESQSIKDFLERGGLEGATSTAPVRCLVTGALAPLARLHSSIKRVPGAQTSGAALVSFNAAAFESHGLKQGSNAPVSEDAATAYVAALNWLLAATDERRHRYGVRICSDSAMVFWTRNEHPDLDGFAALFAPRSEDAVRTAESPWRGLAPSERDSTDFYALVVGGNAARVVIRDWFQSTMVDVKANLRRYFDDLAIGSSDEPLPIARLVDALRSPGRDGKLPSEMATRMFLAALRGTPLPRELLRTALVRLRVGDQYPAQIRARCAVIKAVLRRLPATSAPWAQEVGVSLDEQSTRVPYLLGRLFAALERLQGVALPGINATIRDSYFGAASTTPAIVFPRLLRMSMHHGAKAEGKGVWLEKIKSSILAGLPAQGFPSLLSLEEQGLFAIGYYHQREVFFTKKEGN